MKILHLAAGNRWTGAAAPAFAETAALREAGVDAHYGYVGGYKLQEKLRHCDFAHPLIEKAQNPLSFGRTVESLDRFISRHGFDVIHAHLTYDHWLSRFAARGRKLRLARTFHARRTLRRDPFTRSLVRRTDLVFVINDALRDAAVLRNREPVFTPPPVDRRQFMPHGPTARERYGLEAEATVVMAIGKLSPRRGFEDVLRAFSIFRRTVSGSRLLIVGMGPHRPALELLCRELEIERDVIWAGYHETALAEHYRAADLLFFTAAGSDEGHRAVLEAMACGVIPISYPLPGLSALAGDLAPLLVCRSGSAEALAGHASEIAPGRSELRDRVIRRSDTFTYPEAARRLLAAYEE